MHYPHSKHQKGIQNPDQIINEAFFKHEITPDFTPWPQQSHITWALKQISMHIQNVPALKGTGQPELQLQSKGHRFVNPCVKVSF